MSNPSHSNPEKRETVTDLLAEMFPDISAASGPPPIPIDKVRDILAKIGGQNRLAEMWKLRAKDNSNPIATVLRNGKSVDVVIERPDGLPLNGTLQIGPTSTLAGDSSTSGSFDNFIPSLAARSKEQMFGLAAASLSANDGDDEPEKFSTSPLADEAPVSKPLCLIIPRWPRTASLRGIDVVPIVDGVESPSETVVLTARRITNGFELDYLPEEESVLMSNNVAIRLAVVEEGGDHV